MSIVKRGSAYGARAYIDGRQRWLGTFPSKKLAKEAIAKAELNPLIVRDLTVEGLISLYDEMHIEHKQASTKKNYRRALGLFAEMFGDEKADEIDFIQAQAFANVNSRSTTDAISTMFEWARRSRRVSENPFDGVQRRVSANKVEPVTLSESEVRKLGAVALHNLGPLYGPSTAALILLAAGTGMRPGELFALRWGDIDLARNRVRVRASIGADGDEKAPKNGKPREIVLLRLGAEGLGLLKVGKPNAQVFASGRGRHLQKSTLNYWWPQVRIAAGLPTMRFYDLRHTCATRLLELGAYSYEVAYQLGHQDNGRLVERRYGHPAAEKALDRIARLDAEAPENDPDPGGLARKRLEIVKS